MALLRPRHSCVGALSHRAARRQDGLAGRPPPRRTGLSPSTAALFGAYRISAASWNRSVAALDKLYRWAVEEGIIAASPFSYGVTHRRAAGGRAVLSPERTDGALTVANLAREAGVSRATVNRAGDLLAEFRETEASRRQSSPGALKDRIRVLEAELRAVRGAEMAELRALARTLAQHIQVLTLQVAERDAVIDGLRQELARSGDTKVIPLRRPP
jgi:hypothetical protein